MILEVSTHDTLALSQPIGKWQVIGVEHDKSVNFIVVK